MRPFKKWDLNEVNLLKDLHFHSANGDVQLPKTRARVRLLGPCFKTGRVGYRPTRRRPLVPVETLAHREPNYLDAC